MVHSLPIRRHGDYHLRRSRSRFAPNALAAHRRQVREVARDPYNDAVMQTLTDRVII